MYGDIDDFAGLRVFQNNKALKLYNQLTFKTNSLRVFQNNKALKQWYIRSFGKAV